MEKIYIIELDRNAAPVDWKEMTESDFCNAYGINDYEAFRASGRSIAGILDFQDIENALPYIAKIELGLRSDKFNDEEIIAGVAFSAEFTAGGKTYVAETEPTDGRLENGASEEQITAVIDELIESATIREAE